VQPHQDIVLRWIANEPGSTGILVLAIGLVYAFHGFRFFRPLLALSAGALAWLAGMFVAERFGMPGPLAGTAGAAVAGLASVRFPRPSMVLVCGAVWGLLGYYLGEQAGLDPRWALVCAGLIGSCGLVFGILCQRTMTVVLTTLQGAALIVLGGVGFASNYMPTLGHTLQAWASTWSLLMPVLLAMLVATAYSYQAMHQQGDIVSGT
jgi:hypothetical protein